METNSIRGKNKNANQSDKSAWAHQYSRALNKLKMIEQNIASFDSLAKRYSEDPGILQGEASTIFPGAKVAHDGLTIEVDYDDGPLSDTKS